MILPGMGVISELVPCFSRKPIFGYKFVAFSSIAIALIGFLVWGHHMFVSGQSVYAGIVFSFLSYIVAARLRGDEAGIKAYAVAVDVFGRPATFDPQSDPIVRVQARRLRTLIDEYYAGEGRADPVRIVLPVGRYVPEFERRASSPAATDDDLRDLRAAKGSLRLLGGQIHDLTDDYWISVLERYGVLPNYTLLDDSVTLDVGVTWIDPENDIVAVLRWADMAKLDEWIGLVMAARAP